MWPRPVPQTSTRRSLRSVLAVTGIGLAALGTTLAFAAAPRTLDTNAQRQRLLPRPEATTAAVLRPMAMDERRMRVRRRPPTRSAAPRRVTRPVHISIPAIGVSAPVIPLGLNRDSTVQVPASFAETGWFRLGPKPGEVGAALLVGHVDSKAGPGVFFRLAALERGDRIVIRLADHRMLRFIVTSSRDVAKTHFPAALVFAHTRRPTLRLVTCGGRFDASTGHYVDNHIVFAWLAPGR
jgi:hypothetical protein